MSRDKRYSQANFISDRSGFKFPMKEGVIEPGTGWLVHRSESDGEFSVTNHPANNKARYLKGKQGDPYPVKDARPRPSTETVSAITSYRGVANLGSAFYLTINTPLFWYFVGGASLEGSSSITINSSKVSQAEATLDGISSVSTNSSKVSPTEVTLEGSSSITIEATRTVPAEATLEGSSSITIEATRTVPAEAALNGVSSVTADALISVDLSIAADEDDGEEFTSFYNWSYSDNEVISTGAYESALSNIGLRFVGVPPQQGATITSATITLNQIKPSPSSGPTVATWYAWDTDNASQFDGYTNYPSVVTKTTSNTAWVAATTDTPTLINHDVTSIVQEIVDRVGWSSGNAINFTAMGSVGADTLNIDAADDFSAIAGVPATLNIKYA